MRWKKCFVCGADSVVRYRREVRPHQSANGGIRRRTLYTCGAHDATVRRLMKAGLELVALGELGEGALRNDELRNWASG